MAAVAAAYIAARKVEETAANVAEKFFYKYVGNERKAKEVMDSAKESITVIANCGIFFLEEYKEDLSKYLRKGIKINYLLLDKDNYMVMDKYIKNCKEANEDNYNKSADILNDLKKENKNELEIRIFRNFLTESYICSDLEIDPNTNKWNSKATIQVMAYQYGTLPGNAPMTIIRTKEKIFDTFAETVQRIWEEGEKVEKL